MHVDGALLDIDVLAPHAVEHLLPGVNAFRMADQKMQQTIFSRTEMDRLPVGGNTLAGDIDLKAAGRQLLVFTARRYAAQHRLDRSEEHTSELQSLMRISYAVFCLNKKSLLILE